METLILPDSIYGARDFSEGKFRDIMKKVIATTDSSEKVTLAKSFKGLKESFGDI